jgi:hypothetical protein
MKSQALLFTAVGMIGILASAPASAARRASAPSACPAPQTHVIDSEARCFESGGLRIDFHGDEGIKVACLQDKRVQNVCGPDGRLTRLQAYTSWFARLKQFENTCTGRGGVFSFQDSRFTEPQDESFCLQAQPEIGSNMFEEPLCNYRSLCPAVAVVCEFPCRQERYAARDAYQAPATASVWVPSSVR